MVSRAIWKKHAPVNFKCYRKAQVLYAQENMHAIIKLLIIEK